MAAVAGTGEGGSAEPVSPGEPGRPRRSIGAKLNRLVLLSVGLTLAVAGLASTAREANRFLQLRRDTLGATATVFAAATSDAVARRDSGAVMRALRGLAGLPGFVYAVAEASDGTPVAEVGGTVRLGGDLDIDTRREGSIWGLLTTRTVSVSAPIVQGGIEVGRIRLVGDTAGLTGRFAEALAVAGAGATAALAFGLWLSRRLQRSITGPLSALADAMREIARTNRYVRIALPRTDDETGLLVSRFNGMIDEVARATDAILEREDEIIARLSRAAEQRDDQTGQHVVRVAQISRIIADELALEPAYVEELVRASPMHDVGKIAIPDAILFKPGRLDPEERAQMERHAVAGHRILSGSGSPLVQLAAEIAISHHEKWDGTGYPNRLAGQAIPISGRITAVADVCDALLSLRPYKEPWPMEKVKALITEEAGRHFDPDCAGALLARWSDLEAVYAGERGAETFRKAA